MTTSSELPRTSFLETLPGSVRESLQSLAVPKQFAPGMVIFQEGIKHADIYLVTAGRIRLEMFVPGRGRLPILTVGAGDLVGWSPLLGQDLMTATATALESVQTLAFDGQKLKALCESNPEVGYYVMRQVVRVLSQRLLATRLQLLDLFQEHPPPLR